MEHVSPQSHFITHKPTFLIGIIPQSSLQFDWFKLISYVNWIESDDWMLRQHLHKSILLRWWVYENEKLITCTLIWTSILLFIIIITHSETVGMWIPGGFCTTLTMALMSDRMKMKWKRRRRADTYCWHTKFLSSHSPPNFEIVASASRANLNGWMRFECSLCVAQDTQRTSINACVYIDKSRVWMHCEDSALQ